MKKILKLSLSIVISLSLALPAQGAFSSSPTVSSPTQSSSAILVPTKTIPVISASPDQVVIPAVAGGKNLAPTPCQIAPLATGQILQGSFTLNLNQPASCFPSLAPAHLVAAAAPLAVRPLAEAQPKLIVLVTPPMLSSPDLSASSSSPLVPILPLTVTALAILAFSKRRKLKEALSKLKIDFQGELPKTLHQLVMLRC